MICKLLLPALLVAALWGYVPIIEKKLLEHIFIKTLIVAFGLLYGIVSIILGLIYYKEIKEDLQNKDIFDKVSIKMLTFMIIFYIIGSLIYYILLKDHKSHIVVALTYTTPLFVALFSYLLSQEKITKQSMLGIILIVIGGILVSK
jgi:transporter family protein